MEWETECHDADYAQAMCRAYNRAIVDWCAEGAGRLFGAAHLSLGDPEAAAAELERAVKAGCKGGWVSQFTMTRKPHAHPGIATIVVTGAGKSFCPGMDMAALQSAAEQTGQAEQPAPSSTNIDHHSLFGFILNLRKPVVGAINGNCVGMGFSMALHWHPLRRGPDSDIRRMGHSDPNGGFLA